MSDRPEGSEGREEAPAPQYTGPAPTAEGYTTRGPRSGFWRRFAAAFLDGLLLGAVGYIIAGVFGQDAVTVEDGMVSYEIGGAAFLLSTAVQAAYLIYFEGSAAGQTLGKKVLGIRVIGLDSGETIGYGKAAIRWIGRYASAFLCLLGYLWMLWDKEKQTWHDKFASSIVVPTSAYPVSD